MAAAVEFPSPKVVDLRRLRADDLDLVLAEEVEQWRTQFHWDFRRSAELVKRFVATQSLSGFALMYGPEAAGYAYTVTEERKGVIGGLYLREGYRSIETENLLLEAALGELMRSPSTRRVESQLMMLTSPRNRTYPAQECLNVCERSYMEAPLPRNQSWPAASASLQSVLFERWTPNVQSEAAALIARAYRDHIDATINEQYRTPAGARQFLHNIVQYPGCGSFFQPASWIARVSRGNTLVGISMASLVSVDSGHITQICVDPSMRNLQIGRELLRRSLTTMEEAGCKRVSLTVTHSNSDAIHLYQKFGFEIMHQFAACVWENPG